MTPNNLTVYSLKSRFQTLLLPVRDVLISWDAKPNQITLSAFMLCLIYAALLIWSALTSPLLLSALLLLLPVFMLLRMALNALDGMIASATDNQTAMGGVLNEVCDYLSDAVLFGAFLIILPAYHIAWWCLSLSALLIEFVGLATYQANRMRSLSGPFGKSDRAVYLGIFGVILYVYPQLLSDSSLWTLAYVCLGFVLAAITVWNRIASLYK